MRRIIDALVWQSALGPHDPTRLLLRKLDRGARDSVDKLPLAV